ncbi:hypothetical protein, partial [Enterobacter hormaechei]
RAAGRSNASAAGRLVFAVLAPGRGGCRPTKPINKHKHHPVNKKKKKKKKSAKTNYYRFGLRGRGGFALPFSYKKITLPPQKLPCKYTGSADK